MDMLTKRTALLGLSAAAVASLTRFTGAGQGHPSGTTPFRIVVPFAPGGGADIIGRLLADYIARTLQVPAVVENVPGGSATVGIDRVAKGPADGSHILILGVNFVTTPFILMRLPYAPEQDIIPLAHLTSQPNLLCVRKDLPVGSVGELIAYAQANPGRLNYASSGPGSPMHLAAELFRQMTDIDMTHITYAGSGPAQNALAGGHVDLIFDNVASIIGLARSGSIMPLAITSPERSPLAPEFPAVAETLPGYAAGGWFGTAVRSGTPKPIRDAIEKTSLAFVADPATRERLAAVLADPVGADAETFAAFIASERARWGTLITERQIRI